jgi:hypothetical protein
VRVITQADMLLYHRDEPLKAQHLDWWFVEYWVAWRWAVDITLDVSQRLVIAKYQCINDDGFFYLDPQTKRPATWLERTRWSTPPPSWPAGFAPRGNP